MLEPRLSGQVTVSHQKADGFREHRAGGREHSLGSDLEKVAPLSLRVPVCEMRSWAALSLRSLWAPKSPHGKQSVASQKWHPSK